MDPSGLSFVTDPHTATPSAVQPSQRQSILGSFLRVRPRGTSQSHQISPSFHHDNDVDTSNTTANITTTTTPAFSTSAAAISTQTATPPSAPSPAPGSASSAMPIQQPPLQTLVTDVAPQLQIPSSPQIASHPTLSVLGHQA
ncbi:hypothetical protein PNOK_0653600 [Pyrrhoderma noxium]|uniref:Uncharacterized protein n=1 Tax=Pyrrhoderma noxium TaxID=2282107 RepID=A0A286UEP1_9AGAM|nr:hypothetical protein PNOK_0653600 [Pyrrhoderma noxium]